MIHESTLALRLQGLLTAQRAYDAALIADKSATAQDIALARLMVEQEQAQAALDKYIGLEVKDLTDQVFTWSDFDARR